MKKRKPYISFLLTTVILLIVNNNLNWGKNDWKGALESDAKGYYAYLPAIFIYHDLNFGFLEEVEKKYDQKHLYYDYRSNAEGVLINKYYAGVALLQSPFFLISHFISSLDKDQDADGYSKWYMKSISLSAIFYHLLGLLFIIRLLKIYKISETVIAFVIPLISFGTNLFVYTIVEAGMSHVYSFCFIGGFLWFAKRFTQEKELRWVALTAFFYGTILLIRPVNGLIIFALPFIAGDLKSLKTSLRFFKEKLNYFLGAVFIVSSIVFIQLFIYKLSTGSWLVYSYDEEGFNFFNPHFIDILFSYKKGLFIYTPVYFVALLSVFYFLKTNRFLFFSWMGVFLLITYVFSSWWMWFYGGSFSSRVYVEYLPFFIIPLSLFMDHLRSKKAKAGVYTLLTILILICQLQSYQYRYYEIHYSEMNKEKYWDVFLMRNRFY